MKNNETTWLNANSAYDLLNLAIDIEMPQPNNRRLRLVGISLLRLVWDDLSPGAQQAIVAGERHTEGLLSDDELSKAGDIAANEFDPKTKPGRRDQNRSREYALHEFAISASEVARYDDDGGWPYWQRIVELPVLYGNSYERLGFAEEDVQPALVNCIRDIYGNPFREATLDLTLVTNDIDELAREIHANSDYERLPALGNAMRAAGCTNAEMLNHCSSEETHVRGCWVIDLLLGKNDAINGN